MRKGRPPAFTKAQRLKVFETFGAIVLCQGCGAPMYLRDPITKRRCDIDHWLAWIDGGEHKMPNWRPLCATCHKPKSAHEHKENSRAKARHAKHFGQDDKPKRRSLGTRPLRGRSAWPKCPRQIPSRKFPKRQEAQP